MGHNGSSFQKIEQKLIEWIIRLARSDFRWLGRILLKGLRIAYRHRPAPFESSPKGAVTYPTGPYGSNPNGQVGDLLVWVPRHIESLIIDDLTGRYGYSHITVDTGEVDLPNTCALLRAIDEDRVHPDKKKCVNNLPAQNQVTLKLTVDSTFKQNTVIQVDTSSNDVLLLRVDKPTCSDISLFGSAPSDLGVIKPIQQ